MTGILLLIVVALVVVAGGVVMLLIVRRAGLSSQRPTTWAGRLPYILIAAVLVIVGSLLLAHGR